MSALERLRADHAAFMAGWKGNRQTLITPCCSRDLEVEAPTALGESWDSLMTCPHCGEMFFMVAFVDVARGFIPAEAQS